MIKLNNLGKTYISNSTLTVGIEHIDDYVFRSKHDCPRNPIHSSSFPPSRSRGGLDIVVIRLLTPLFLCVIICSREAVE